MATYFFIVLTLGALYGLLALATCLSFRFFSFPDLTLDGSFVTGASISALMLRSDVAIAVAILGGFLGGAAGGVLTTFLHKSAKINKLFSGILSAMILFSANLRILGGANMSLLDEPGLFAIARTEPARAALCMSVFILLVITSCLFFFTRLGLLLRAMGSNPDAAKLSRRQEWALTGLALGIANGIAGLAGALIGQFQGFVDVNMGFGIAIASFAALFLGESLVSLVPAKRSRVSHCLRVSPAPVKGELIAVLVGAMVYNGAVTCVLFLGFPASDQKALGAFILVIGMAFRRRRHSDILTPVSRFET